MRLLLAEDEKAMAEAVADVLTYHHFQVDVVDNGEDAFAYLSTGLYDGAVLDIMMPGKSGLEVLRQLRMEGNELPILLLTALGEVDDRISGFNSGADDYLPKPFVMEELLARVRALLRRRGTYMPEVLQCGDLSLNLGNCELTAHGQSILLSKTEFQLMELLMRNQGTYLSSETLLVKIWGYNTEISLGVVWIYVTYLRKHLVTLESRVCLLAKRGIGYRLEVKS